jgi:bile salt-stimulated lipase
LTGDEDCLYLNIYTPTLDKNAKLDVIVYIHGGAFMFLYGGFYGPHYIMDKDVVFINLNYRLGPLGNPMQNLVQLEQNLFQAS